MNNFTHLNVHSEYSIIDGIIQIKKILSLYKKYKIKTICITDILVLTSLPEFFFCEEIKPMIGVECYLLYNGEIFSILLYAKNYIGYTDINTIVSNAWRYGNIDNGVFIKLQWLKNFYKNIIIVINLRNYIINNFNIKYKNFYFLIKELIILFNNNIYLEISRLNFFFEEFINNIILKIEKKFKINLLATNSVKFLFKKEFTINICKTFLSQNKNFNDSLFFDYSEHQYIKNYNQILFIFKDIVRSVINIKNVIFNCNLLFKLYSFDIPNIKVNNCKIRIKIFDNLIKIGLKHRILKKKLKISKTYINRINKEIILVKKLGIIDYFLILTEFKFWAKFRDIRCGPGRGSGSGSLICYCLYITDIDPVNENLLFERFIFYERIGLPDLDLDFCVLKRENFVNFIINLYNYNNVAQVISYHSVSTKSSIRDLSRAIGIDYLSGDRFARCLNEFLDIKMEISFRKSLRIRSFIYKNKKAYDIWNISSQLEGVAKTISKHAGGIVISNKKLSNYVSILFDDEECLTNFEKIILQDIGLIKFDFLGLKTLSIIDLTFKIIPEISTGEFMIDDYKTYKMINNLETDLVFQLESYGMKRLIHKLPVNNIFDIINLLSLYRPGPIQSGFINDFINRKSNLIPTYHPFKNFNFSFSKIVLANTHGLILFQEQVVQLIKFYTEFNNYDSERVYNLMIKKSKKDLLKVKKIFIKKCFEKKISQIVSSKFFDVIDRFASYSFNKTHAHSYAKIVFQTAYLKANYKLEYFLSCIYVDQLLNIDYNYLIRIMKKNDVVFFKPDINLSDENLKIYKSGFIYGFNVINFTDEFFIDKILYYRNKIFFYNNFELFCKIYSTFKIISKKIIEDFIFSGFFDCFKINRIFLFINFQFIYEKIKIFKLEYNRTIIFKFLKYLDFSKLNYVYQQVKHLTLNNVLNIEKKKLKFFTSFYPSEFLFIKLLGHKNFNKIKRLEDISYNLVIAFSKYRNFINKKSYILEYKEHSIKCYKFSDFVKQSKINFNCIFLLKNNKIEKKNYIIKYFKSKFFFNSIGTIYILNFQFLPFNINNILNKIINKTIYNAAPLYIKIKYKMRYYFFYTKINIKFTENFILYLKKIGIFYFTKISCCK